jgi:hypothetical protein
LAILPDLIAISAARSRPRVAEPMGADRGHDVLVAIWHLWNVADQDQPAEGGALQPEWRSHARR